MQQSACDDSARAGDAEMKIVNLIPIPICWGLMGAIVFALIDALTGMLFGRFISDVWQAVLASALLGNASGLLGWLVCGQ